MRQRDVIEKFRKKAFITRRKAERELLQNLTQEAHPNPSTSSVLAVPNGQSSPAAHTPTSEPEFDPFTAIVEFFVSGGADKLSDDDAFKTLAELVRIF